MTTTIRSLVATGLLLCSASSFGQTLELSSTGELLDGIVAVVNDGIVLKSELQTEMQSIVQRLNQQGTQLPPMNQLVPQVLERLVVQQLQMQRAERVGIQISDETLNQALATIAQRNGVSLPDLPSVLAGDGLDYATFRATMRKQIAIDQLKQRDVIGRINVSPRELDEFLARQRDRAYINKEFKISHILVSVSSSATSKDLKAAEDKIKSLRQQALAGESFAELAVAFSDGQQALEGGDLGWRKGNELPTLFADVVPELEAGQISEPIRSASGFHLVQVADRRGGEPIMEEQIHSRHILITTNEVLDDDTAKQKLSEIRAQIAGGDDFEAVAKAISEDPVSGVDGGDLGWTGPGALVPEYDDVVAELEIGELSEPFQTQYGWHLVQLLDRRVHDTTEEVERQKAIMAIRNSKLSEETELWTRRLRDEAFVEYRL